MRVVGVEGSGGVGAGRSESAEVEGVGSGSVEVEGVGAGGSGSMEVEGVEAGGSESVEVEGVGGGGNWSVEVEGVGGGGSGSMEVEGEGVEEGGDECGLPSTSEDAGTVPKRRRLSAIGDMADEPVQSWLDNLPHDDWLCYCMVWTLED